MNVATQLAEKMICQWGMDEELGMAVIRERNGLYGDLGNALRDRMNAVLKQLLDEAMTKIEQNKRKVELLADMLIQENHMDSKNITDVLESGFIMDVR